MGLQEDEDKSRISKAKDLVHERRRAEEQLTKLRTVDFVEKLAAGSKQTQGASKAKECNNGSCSGSLKRASKTPSKKLSKLGMAA